MSGIAPTELTASSIIAMIGEGSYPREVVLTFAGGFLPLEQQELVSVLAFLAVSEDEEVAMAARASLSDIPVRILFTVASDEKGAPEHLERLALASNDNTVLEALIRNRAVSDDAVAELARRAEPALQEVIVINQARIIRAPQILDALLANPKLTTDVRRRALETREEFFDKRARAEEAAAAIAAAEDEEELIANLSLDPIADLLEKAADEPETGKVELLAAEAGDEKSLNVMQMLLTMNVAQKVQLAFKGNKTVRMILVRERNKLIARATMRNPRMTETEIESIAAMRNVDEEVLRLVALKREWIAKYSIVLALVRNPKAPLGIVLPLINRLTLRDLKGLKDDRNVPEVVRASARKLYQARTSNK